MAKCVMVLYPDPVDGYPPKYARDSIPTIKSYPDGSTVPSPSSIDFTPGELIEFNAPDGGRYAGVLKEVSETSALFDFNHPLAGQALTFEVKIIGIL